MSASAPLLDLSRGLPGGRLWRPLCAFVEQALALDAVNALYARHRQGDPAPEAFCRRLLEGLGVGFRIAPVALQRLADLKGPLLVLANHPLGGRDALMLNVLLGLARPDYRILSNFIIGRLPEVRSRLILVDPFGGKKAAQGNRSALRESLQWLGQGGLLGVFPAGEVSAWQGREGRVADGPWAGHVARLARLSGATVVPVHFSAESSWRLRALAWLHPRLKTLYLARELMHGPARTIEARIGRPLLPVHLPACDDAQASAWLRRQCYALAD